MPTLESSLRGAQHAGLSNDTVIRVRDEIAKSLTGLVPKKLLMQQPEQQQAASPKAGELFLKGAQVLCEQGAEGQPVLELALRAAAVTGTEADLTSAVERVSRANALFTAAQKAATVSYGSLNVSSVQALDQWLLATANPEETVKETHRRLRDAHLDFTAAAAALTSHRGLRPNQDVHLVQCKEQESKARALLARGRATLKDLGIPMTPEILTEWDVSIYAGRLERLGHCLFQPKAELEYYNLPVARAGVARAIKLVKGLGRVDEAVPDPIVALLETALECMDHPLVRNRIFVANTTFGVGAKSWAADDAPESHLRKLVSPPPPSLSQSSSAPILGEDTLVLPRGFFVEPRASTSSSRLREGGPTSSFVTLSTSTVGAARDERSKAGLRATSSQAVLRPTSLLPPPLSPPSPPDSARNSKLDGQRYRTTVPARSSYHIKVDESLSGMNGSGRVLELELKRLRTELEARLRPQALAATELDMDQSGLVRTLARALSSWLTRYEEREKQREEDRDLAVLAEIAKKRAAALYTHTAIDEAGAKSVMEHLRKALANNLARTMDFFRDTDTDQSGFIDRREFRRAVAKVVPGVTKGVCAALFDLLDEDKSDSLEYAELHARLRVTLESARPGEKQAGKYKTKERPKAERSVSPTTVGQHLLLRAGDGIKAAVPSHA